MASQLVKLAAAAREAGTAVTAGPLTWAGPACD